MSNLIVKTNRGSGFFSVFHCALELLIGHSDSYDINSFKIILHENSVFKNKHIFDNIFDYSEIDGKTEIITEAKEVGFLKAYGSPQYDIMRNILSKNKINPVILNNVEQYKQQFQIDTNTLAIHIRLTDMNVWHAADHGYRSFNDYCNKLNEMLEKYTNINSIYVMSDNTESIQKLVNIYSSKYKVNYIMNNIRNDVEEGDCLNFTINKYNTKPDIEITLFTEVLVGSACSYFIYRVSDVANFTILYSNTFKVIECLN